MKLLVNIVIALSLLAGMLATSPVYASSESLVLAQVQLAGNGSGTASEELIVLYNSSTEDIEVTDWCVYYATATNSSNRKLACIEPPDAMTEIWILSGGFVMIASAAFLTANPDFAADYTFTDGLAAGGGHVWLEDSFGAEVDRLGWGTAVLAEGGVAAALPGSGEVLSRELTLPEIDTDINAADFSSQPVFSMLASGLFEIEVLVDLCTNIEELQVEIPARYMADGDQCYEDFCPNLAGLQLEVPAGYEQQIDSEDCSLIPLEDAVLFITELLPNAPSVDTGQEFIELYNPNNRAVSLVGYQLQLGPGFSKTYTFTAGSLQPGEFRIFSDAETGITLPNANGVQLRLLAATGNTVSESASYTNADDDVSWALIEDAWVYTNQITPNGANKPYLEPAIEEVAGVTSVLAPCPAGKYRNPETNRCRNIESAISSLVPCDEDEYRNTETNRCRKVSSASSSLAPCDEGEERNPETNRCRKVSVLGVDSEDELPTVADVEVENTAGSINWPVISLALASTVGYMLYEWRRELQLTIMRFQRGRNW